MLQFEAPWATSPENVCYECSVNERQRAVMEDLACRNPNAVHYVFPLFSTWKEDAFGSEVDYARLVKVTGAGAVELISGRPNPGGISTALIERHNLTLRMGLRRFTRKTNGHSKRVPNHRRALTIFLTYYNFVRVHMSLGTTPAVAAGLADRPMSLEWLVRLAS